jgi:HlyD family secretion protein
MKHKLILFLILVLFVLTACAPQGAPSAPTPIPTPIVAQKPTYTVQRGEVVRVLELRGRVSAVKQEDLFFGVNGVVDQVLVSRGDMVKAGQVLAHLTERESLEAALADSRLDLIKTQKALDALTEEADLHSAEALVAMLKAQTELEEAKNERARLDRPRASAITIAEAETHFALMEENLIEARKQWENVENRLVTDPERAMALMNLTNAQRARDQALANLNWYVGHSTEQQISAADAKVALAEAKYQEAVREYERLKDGPDPYDIAIAEATLARAQVNLNKAQADLDNLTITAPFDGQVLSMAMAPGMQVTAFKTVLTLVDPEGLEITLLPTSTELAEISVGQAALIRLPNRPGQEYSGIVRHLPLSSGSSSSGQGSDQSVRVSLEDSSTELTMGEVATVLIQLEERENTLWISPAALRTFQSRDFVIIQDGEVQRRVDIRLGLKSQDRVEILEGLSEGQVVLGP